MSLDVTVGAGAGCVWIRFVGARPPTLNGERASSRGRWGKSETTKQWRTLAALHARGLPPVEPPVEIQVTPGHKDRRSPQDAGACIPAAKAVIDGLVDAGVLTGDGPDVVHQLTFRAPTIGADGLVVRVLRRAEWQT